MRRFAEKNWPIATVLSTIIGGLALLYSCIHDGSTHSEGKDISSLQASEFEDGTCGSVGLNRSSDAGWGPNRKFFTLDDPAPYATLNSITDHPFWGNERSFFGVRESGDTSDLGFCSSLKVSDGDILTLRVYVENSGPDFMADTEYAVEGYESLADGSAVARDVRLQIYPDKQEATLRWVSALISSSTTDPPQIWNDVELSAAKPFRLDYIRGSARLFSSTLESGPFILSDDIWDGPGVLLGYEEMDGRIQPGYKYDLIIVVEVRVTTVA